MSKTPRHRSPPLGPDELRQLQWLLGSLLTLLATWSVFFMDTASWPWVFVTTAATSIAFLRPGSLHYVPRWVHRMAFPAIVTMFVADLWLSGELLSSMVRLDLLLLCYRNLTYRKKRDDLQLVVLSLFLVVVAGVLTVSILFALQILGFTAVALMFLLTLTLADAHTPSATDEKTDAPPRWTRQLSWPDLLRRIRATTDWRVVTFGATLFAGLVVLSGFLFLAIPRFQLENSLWLDRLATKKTKTGFTDTIRFGDVTEILQDNAVALTVDLSDRSRMPDSPYWRMLVLDEYQDGTFRLSTTLRRAAFGGERRGTVVPGRSREGPYPPVTWTIYLEAGVSQYLPLLGAFDRLQFRDAQSFRFGREIGTLGLHEEPPTMTAYRIENMDTDGRWPDDETIAWMESRRHGFRGTLGMTMQLNVSATDQVTLTAAVKEITKGEQLRAAAFAARATEWLDSRHTYSLRPVIPEGGGDPLVRWLGSREGGHCELFAGSLVLLARTAGIPARVVTGFHGGVWNGYSNSFTVRNSDAHAWCEVFDSQTGRWSRADPTPVGPGANGSAAENAARAARLDRSFGARIDSLRVFWYRRIVSFDQNSQIETWQAVKKATEDSGRWVRETLARGSDALKRWLAAARTSGRAALSFAVAVLGVGLLGWLAVTIRRARWKRRGVRGGADPVRIEAGKWLARLRTAEPVGSVDTQIDDAAGRALIAELQRLRFGARGTWGDATEVFRRARSRLRETKRRRVKALR